MTDSVKPKKEKAQKDYNKINLSQEAASQVDRWLDQVKVNLFGSRINRSLLTSWYILQAPEELNGVQLEKLKTDFHSEVGFAQWLSKEIARRHTLGEKVSVQDIIKEKLEGHYRASTAPRKRKKKTLDSSISPTIESDTKIEGADFVPATPALLDVSDGEF